MFDIISRTAAIDAVMESYNAIRAISELPSIEIVPVKCGRWINEKPNDSLDPRMRCSVCSGVECPTIKWRYCPFCGAKMVFETGDNNDACDISPVSDNPQA